MLSSSMNTALMLIFFSTIRNFTAAHSIRVEAGLSQVMDQYEQNFKVRQIMGGVDNRKSGAIRDATLL
jgi:hypothetical protein